MSRFTRRYRAPSHTSLRNVKRLSDEEKTRVHIPGIISSRKSNSPQQELSELEFYFRDLVYVVKVPLKSAEKSQNSRARTAQAIADRIAMQLKTRILVKRFGWVCNYVMNEFPNADSEELFRKVLPVLSIIWEGGCDNFYDIEEVNDNLPEVLRCCVCDKRFPFSKKRRFRFLHVTTVIEGNQECLVACSRECQYLARSYLERIEECQNGELKELKDGKIQLAAIRRFLQTRSRAVLRSLPQELGPALSFPK